MKFLTNLSLGKKITLLTAIGLMLGVGVFSFLGMRAVQRATETMLQDRLTTAYLVADYLDETLGRALTELNSTVDALGNNGGQSSLESQVDSLTNTYSRLSMHAYGVYLLDWEGRVIWSKSESPGVSGSASPQLEAALAIAREQPGISGLVSAPGTDDPVIFLSSPIGRGQLAGSVLAVAIDPAQSSIGGFVQPIRLGQTGYVEVIDQAGTVVTRTDPGPKLAPFEKSDHSGRFAALIAAGKPTRGVCHTCHEPETKVERRDVLAFLPLTQARWGVIIRQSEDEALASTRELYRSLLLFGVGLVTIALGFVVVTTRDIGGRIRMLTSASQRIAEGDLASPVPTSGGDEVGQLAQTLDGMRAKLKTSYSQLEQKTEELSSLLSVSEILTSPLELPALLQAVVAKAVDIIPAADGGVLFLQKAEGASPVIQCAIGLEGQSIGSPAAPADPVGQKDMLEGAVSAFIASHTNVKSYVRAEVSHNERHTGSLLMVSLRDSEAFSESDRRLLGAIADYVAIGIEKSQLAKEAEEVRALQEVDRLRSQLISSVSHELRTPLTLIKGYSTSLLRPDVSWDRAAQQEFLRIIDDKTDELRELIDKLLQSAKLEAGVLRLEKEPVLIPRLAQKVVQDLAPRTKKHRFTLDFAPAFPVIEADSRCMEQVLRNLVENAIKYSPEGTEITLAGGVKDGQVVASVSDQGVGIAPEHQDRIFGRFYRVDSPATHGIPGSGLGLFIVKGHVEAHGGRVWLESTAGKGSTFYFSLPLVPGGYGDGKDIDSAG